MTVVRVGTFNLNNLFSRFNFQTEIDAVHTAAGSDGGELAVSYEFNDPHRFKIRTYKGRLVKGKNPEDQKLIAGRILAMDLDVLAVQEVEDIDTLRFFCTRDLRRLYPHLTLIEGNDRRLIDVALLSKFPLGAVTSWQHAVHPDRPGERVFSRDLLEADVMAPDDRDKRLFTLFNNHLKSQFVEHDQDPVAGKAANDELRRRQAEVAQRIVAARTRPDSRFLVLGDMNDAPAAAPLAPLVNSSGLSLTNALTHPTQTREPKPDDPPPPASGAWTHRFKESGKPAKYELFDQIWLSPALAELQRGAFVDRRTRHAGDGSDHDPAWVELDLEF
ncbi:endonuclease/exonuclease/phosphatase family protein [Streptomyces cinnamoneus]|uniref:endonuclease/exonuclease/phosphatase family protein n=1 Tax=Streptomyces cinnamoneus TaxID=53446 RepID=UPI0037AC72C8